MKRINDIPVWGEPVDASGAYPDGKPASSHTYQHLQQLPASMGGGPKGSTILLCSYAAGRAAMGAGVSYRLDHATGEWSRYSTNAAHTSPTPQKTILDPLRKCYWKVGVGGHTVSRLDTSTRTWTDLYAGSAGGNNFGIGSVAAYYPAFDWMIVIDFWAATQAVHLWRLDLKNTPGGWKRLAHTGDVPPFSAQGPSINFSPSLNKFGVYAQRGQDFIRYLNPPDDPAGDWIWTHQTFTGDAPVKGARSTAESYNRMQWIEKLKSWAWFDGVENPVQLWRP